MHAEQVARFLIAVQGQPGQSANGDRSCVRILAIKLDPRAKKSASPMSRRGEQGQASARFVGLCA
jgi:hypothetical protein